MSTFELYPASHPNGTFAAAWFDDEACLWNDKRLSGYAPLSAHWVPPRLGLHRPKEGATAVLFNPNAIAVSQGVRDELASHAEIEFLPVQIESHGVFYILHVTATVELPLGSKARIAPPPSGNIVQIEAFPPAFEPPAAFFRIRQPPSSAAGRLAATTKALYLSAAGAKAIEACTGMYLTAREVASA